MPATYSNTFKLIFRILGIPAGILVFLPFGCDVTALEVALTLFDSFDSWPFALVGISFLSAFFILAWKVRIWIPISVKKPEIIVGFSIAGVCLLAPCINLTMGIVENGPYSIREWALISIPFVLIFLCLVLSYINFRELEQCVRNILIHKDYQPQSLAQEESNEADPLKADSHAANLTADELLRQHVTKIYAQTRNYEETARQLKLDRRTVKKYIDKTLLEKLTGQS